MRHVPSLAGDVEELVGYVYTEVGWDYYAQVPPSPPLLSPLSAVERGLRGLVSATGCGLAAAAHSVASRVRMSPAGRASGQRRVGGAAPWEMAVRESRAGPCQPHVRVQLMCATTVTS